MQRDCSEHADLASCQVYKAVGAPASSDFADARIKAVVSINLGLERGFDPASLGALKPPILIIAAGVPNPEIPAELESRHLADFLPATTTKYLEVQGSAHFSFLQICKPGAIEILESDSPSDGMICGGETRDRQAIHDETEAAILDFLASALSARLQ